MNNFKGLRKIHAAFQFTKVLQPNILNSFTDQYFTYKNGQSQILLNMPLKNNLLIYQSQNYFSSNLDMPALSPTMSKGNIAKWNFKVGDKVGPGDFLCEIETDKASVGFEMQEEGYIAKLLYQEGEKDIPVGTTIAILVDTKEDIDNLAKQAPAPTKKSETSTSETQKQSSSGQQNSQKSNYPHHNLLKFPALSPTGTGGKIVSWKYKVGDKVVPGDILMDVETDKATVGFEMQEEGYVAKVILNENSGQIKVGDVVGILVDSKDDISAFENYQYTTSDSISLPKAQEKKESMPQDKKTTTTEQIISDQNSSPNQTDRLFISPYAKKIANEKGVSLENLRGKGSGIGGRIISYDVLAIANTDKKIAKEGKIFSNSFFSNNVKIRNKTKNSSFPGKINRILAKFI